LKLGSIGGHEFGTDSFDLIKKRPKSPHEYSSKTGVLYKLFLLIGLILLIFYGVQHIILLVEVSEHILGIVLAFSILFLGGGFLIYFLSCQFAKLAKIVDEIENEEDMENLD